MPAAAATLPATAATATTWGPRLTWPRFVHGESASFDGLSVDLGNRVLSVLFRSHRDERETARFTGKFILHQSHFLHRTGLREKLLEFVFSRIERKIAYV